MRWSIWGLGVCVALSGLACSAILGIHDPEVDGIVTTDLPDGSLDGRTGDSATSSDASGDGPVACPANRADCNNNAADGCETDTTQPQNCGSCGHVCLACESGKCAPQVLASGGGLDYTGLLAVDGQSVYWASPGSKNLYAVPKAGGTPTSKTAADPMDATTIYVGPTYLGVSAFSPVPGLRLLARASGSLIANVQVDGCQTALGVIADETDAIYYAHGSNAGACGTQPFHITKRTPNGGGGFFETWDFAAGTYATAESEWLALDAQNLYFVGYRDTASGVYRISRAGGASSIVVPGRFVGAPLAVDDKNVYSIRNNDLGAVGDAELVAVDKATSGVTVLAIGEPSFKVGGVVRASLVIDATHVYWTADDGADDAGAVRYGRVMRVKKAGGAKEVLADKEPAAYGLAVDDGFVYWSSAAGIKRIPK